MQTYFIKLCVGRLVSFPDPNNLSAYHFQYHSAMKQPALVVFGYGLGSRYFGGICIHIPHNYGW